VDMFPTTDSSKDINAVLSRHVETVVKLYRAWSHWCNWGWSIFRYAPEDCEV